MRDLRRELQEMAKRALPKDANYDEAKVPQYELPDPLTLADGTRVTDAQTWIEQRRPEILSLFERHVYGRAPGRPDHMRFEITSADEDALDGRATRKEVSILFADEEDPKMDLLIYIPNSRRGPTPVFVGLNNLGNQAIHPDPGIALYRGWVPDFGGYGLGEFGVENNHATEASRGVMASGWPVGRVLERGCALATACWAPTAWRLTKCPE